MRRQRGFDCEKALPVQWLDASSRRSSGRKGTALSTARGVWNYKLERKRMTAGELDQKMAFIAPTLDLTGLNTVDLVTEVAL